MSHEQERGARTSRARIHAHAGVKFGSGVCWAIGCLCSLFVQTAFAAPYFVAPNGSDSAPGSISRPWRTVSAALGRLNAGDTLYVRAGSYFESPVIRRSGTAAAPIVVRAYPGEKVIIDSGYPELEIPGNSEWELVDAATGEYRTKRSHSNDDVYAYIAGIPGYENERVCLVPYAKPEHFRATTDEYNSTAFYVGPGTLVGSDGRIHVRLAKTSDVHAIEARYGQVFDRDLPNPADYSIVLSQSSHTLRVGGSYLVIKDLILNQGKRTILIEGGAHDLRFEGLTMWMGGQSISVTGTGVHSVVVTGCRIYGDSPLWVFWSDMKDSPYPADLMRSTSIDLRYGTHDWEISYCHIRGSGQDLIGTNQDEYDIKIHHNRIENAADDGLELEGTTNVGRIEVYENYIGNCLVAIAPGQDTPRYDGPLLVYRNVIVLLRDPPVNRKPGINTWNGGGRFGFEYMFKQSASSSYSTRNAHYYQNTLVMLGSNGRGINITPKFVDDARIANNLMVMVNGRVNGPYESGPGEVVNGNLYWKVNTVDREPLIDDYDTVSEFAAATGFEANGIGATPRRGTDPKFATFDFGVVDRSATRWALEPDAERYGPADFLLAADSPARGAGIVIPPHPVLGTMPDTRSSRDIGALPYGTSASSFDVFPFDVSAPIAPPALPGSPPGNAPTNRPPQVGAGSDQDMSFGDDVRLDGVVSDDGLPDPPGALTTAWTMVSGPAPPSIADPASAQTIARFPKIGTYVMQLSADDGAARDSDQVTIEIIDPTAPAIIERRVASGTDDAEERASGGVSTSSSDLEMTFDAEFQTVGIRFPDIQIPRGAYVREAYVQFQTDEVSTDQTVLTIRAEAADDAAPFSTSQGDISHRVRTAAATWWSPPPWPVVGEAGDAQRTPDISTIIHEVLQRPKWKSGNAIVLLVSGSGRRTAEAFEGSASGAPMLHIDLGGVTAVPGENTAPIVTAGPDLEVEITDAVTLSGSVYDDGQPDPPGRTATTWSLVSGPAAATFADASALSTAVQFPLEGTYVVRLTADDGEYSSGDEATVVVREPPPLPTTYESRVATSSDDAEERSGGRVSLTSSDLELVTDGGPQVVGMRFTGVDVPHGATIKRAFVRFQVNEVTTDATMLTIHGEASDDAPPFTSASGGLSTRPRTASSVGWTPEEWRVVGQSTSIQQTPNLAPVIQDIVDRPGWRPGGAIALLVTGEGRRTAESFDGDPGGAPLLHIEVGPARSAPADPPANQAPVVDAGVDLVVTLPGRAMLSGHVTDDGLPDPPATVVTHWTMIDGPAPPTIDDHAALETDVEFAAPGIYRFRLTASDGAAAADDSLTITVREADATATDVTVQVAASNDDAEERTSGTMFLNSNDLELVNNHGLQLVGLRFPSVPIPAGAVVVRAYVQFETNETNDEATALSIQGQAAADAAAFAANTHNISSRPRTSAAVSWAPLPWTTVGEAGDEQRTPDVAPIIREIVARPGWAAGNALALIISGVGQRTAQSFDGNRGSAPVLHVELASESITNSLAGLGPENREPVLVPNPMRDWASLRFTTLFPGPAKLRLFDVNGRQIRTVLDTQNLPAGDHKVNLQAWGREGFRAGVYFYRLETPQRVSKGRFLVVD